VGKKVDINRIYYVDRQNYFNIVLDGKNNNLTCRLHLNRKKKYLGLFDENKNESKVLMENVQDIFNHKIQLLKTIDYYVISDDTESEGNVRSTNN